ncbi:MAG TPA: hypothetical protein VEF04_11290 [Blastocatellia bacterium]|nr:hypothetical protein [Blastocatellia bacterium]
MKKAIINFLIVLVITTAVVGSSFAQYSRTASQPEQNGPYTLSELNLTLRRSVGRDMTQADLAARIDRLGIAFDPTPEIINRLRTNGAYPLLLNSIRRAGERFAASAILSAGGTVATTNVITADPIIEEVRRNVRDYIEGLPDFICQQEITRYIDRDGTGGWERMDSLTYEITYNGKRETYKPLRVNGYQAGQALEKVGGATSTGDFASRLAMLFDPETRATFKAAGKERLGTHQTLIYDFKVPRATSKNTLQFEPLPAVIFGYSGSVWVDAETKQVLRIELAAEDLPPSYTGISAENIIDYEMVKLRGLDVEVLLPIRAEIVLGDRGRKRYSRNVNVFKFYRKFETDIKLLDDVTPEEPSQETQEVKPSAKP